MTVTKMSQFYFESYQSISIRTIVSYLHSHYSTRPLICTVYNFTKFDIIFLAILPIPESFLQGVYNFEEYAHPFQDQKLIALAFFVQDEFFSS